MGERQISIEAGLEIADPVYLQVGLKGCLLYTSDAADELLCVDLGGRRIIQKKKNRKKQVNNHLHQPISIVDAAFEHPRYSLQ